MDIKKKLLRINEEIAETGWKLESWSFNRETLVLRFQKDIFGDGEPLQVALIRDEEDLIDPSFVSWLKKYLIQVESYGI